MVSEATISAIRFGYGLGRDDTPGTAQAILSRLDGPDRMAASFRVAPLDEVFAMGRAFQAARKTRDTDERRFRQARAKLFQTFADGFTASLTRIAETDTPFRERLAWFWADHFTAVPKTPIGRAAAPGYVDEAIRPHLTGRFADMLKAVVTHPFMLSYLDQMTSAGPNSRAGNRRDAGLNENLAREVLELHTLGVGGAYSQDDVRQLAELMTGLSIDIETGFVFRRAMAEPGAETVLGKTYGGGRAELSHVLAAMDDLAVHPDTARHIARKLAVHFVAEDPDPDLIEDLASVWSDTDGDLGAVTRALVEHPASWGALGTKAKPPFDFVASTLVALGAGSKEIGEIGNRGLRRFIALPMQAMGQPWMGAPGPDGWPEEAAHWITPQGLATRISWARGVTEELADRLPDPRVFLDRALADHASPRLTWAVGAAETKAEGVMLTLASAEFNLR